MDQYSPDDMLNIIDLALHYNMSKIAKQLVQKAHTHFPDHANIQRVAHVLTLAKAQHINTVHPEGLHASQTWLQEHASDYRGVWVALRDGALLAQAKTLKELKELATPLGNLESMLITKIV